MGDHGQVSVGLVDRESQVAELPRHVDAARNGQPGLMLCGGEPGVGKTRLAKEAEYLALGRGMSVAGDAARRRRRHRHTGPGARCCGWPHDCPVPPTSRCGAS